MKSVGAFHSKRRRGARRRENVIARRAGKKIAYMSHSLISQRGRCRCLEKMSGGNTKKWKHASGVEQVGTADVASVVVVVRAVEVAHGPTSQVHNASGLEHSRTPSPGTTSGVQSASASSLSHEGNTWSEA